eukprot:3499727-Rhodomonas_salina.1
MCIRDSSLSLSLSLLALLSRNELGVSSLPASLLTRGREAGRSKACPGGGDALFSAGFVSDCIAAAAAAARSPPLAAPPSFFQRLLQPHARHAKKKVHGTRQ